jgi:hypothetical protein
MRDAQNAAVPDGRLSHRVYDARVRSAALLLLIPLTGCPDDTCTGDGCVNLIVNSDFELGIDGWNGYSSSQMHSDIAHGGLHGVLVCATPPEMFYTLFHMKPVVAAATMGDKYTASVWVRAAPGSPAQHTKVVIEERGIGGVHGESGPLLLTEAWQPMQIDHTVKVAGALGFILKSDATGPGACFIADDAGFGP